MCAKKADNLFFDPGKARGPRKGPDVGEFAAPDARGGAAPASAAAPLTVSALVSRIKGALDAAFPARVAVVGEISNLKMHSSGHVYFSLKDAGASIAAVMFRGDASRLKFTPTDGLEVVAEGRVDLYETRGQLQLYVEQLSPKGAGALELAFRQLREKLQREGLFDPAAKRPPVRFPRAIGIVTSPTGAAIRDIRNTLLRRWPAARVYLAPALVQGDGAAESVAQAVALLDANAARFGIDTIIVARGGGSLEDLWAFNEEVVARTIFAARTPIISGVGHEVDVTICDLVADVRAATPTAAAEMAVPDAQQVSRHVRGLGERLGLAVGKELRNAQAVLSGILRSVVFRDPASRLRSVIQRVDELSRRLPAALRHRLAADRRRLEPATAKLAAVHPARMADRARARLERLTERIRWALGGRGKRAGDTLLGLQGRLLAVHPGHQIAMARQKVSAAARQIEAMSYRGVLKRGFTVNRIAGRILRSVSEVRPGDLMETEFHDGRVSSRTTDGRAGAPGGGQAPAAAPAAKKSRRTDTHSGPGLFDNQREGQ